jgi:peptidoglycan/LPS O-acetylase OafA/YrhL
MRNPAAVDARPSRIEGLDLLRGVAIVLVMLRHAWPSVFEGAGVVGIVLFFTLSGYLITGVLARELRERGRVDLRRFYLRRACRLVPALVGMVGCFALVSLTFDPLGDRDSTVRSIVIALTYTADLPIQHGSPALFHLWTLAVEEQFYLVWPAFLAFAWTRRLLGSALVLAGTVSLALCVAVLVRLAPDYDLAYALPTSWAVCFVVGAATRLGVDSALHRDWARLQPEGQPRLTRIAVPAMTALAVMCVLPLRGHATTYLLGGPAIAVSTSALLVTWCDWRRVYSRILRPLVALGTISYGVYLWNYPVTLWLREWDWAGADGLAIAASILIAAISWQLVERPVMRWAARGPARTLRETPHRVERPEAL